MQFESKDKKLTPMMQQYWTAKKSLENDQLLFFRLGDFYEMFYEDAIKTSALLGLTLTKRADVPMCGVPAHTIDNYIKRLLQKGEKVALCEQTTPVQKGVLVEREVVETISPGTITNPTYLDSHNFNFLLAVIQHDTMLTFAWIDISTGDMFLEIKPYTIEHMRMMLGKIQPKELLFPDAQESALWIETMHNEFSVHCTRQRDWNFSLFEGERMLKDILNIQTLKAYKLDSQSIVLSAVAALLYYVKGASKHTLSHIHTIKIIDDNEFLEIDADAMYNLELFQSMREHNTQFSLYGILDRCKTGMGAREMRRWVSYPLKNLDMLIIRQKNIRLFYDEIEIRLYIQNALGHIIDIPRMLTKTSVGKAHPKDIAALRNSAESILAMYEYVQSLQASGVREVLLALFSSDNIDEMKKMIEYLQASLVSNPPMQFGGEAVIAQGFDEQLDYLRSIYENQQSIIQSYVAEEQKTISFSLKLKFNNVIGYFFEVGHTQKDAFPAHFILRQSLSNKHRYKTEKLIALETEIFSAEHSLYTREESLFINVRDALSMYIAHMKGISESIATIDVSISLADIAVERKYICPVLTNDDEIIIENGRHPVIERAMPQGDFVSNDMSLDKNMQSFIMLTGPNMSGKSTYLRQNALIVIMAQMGSFVPASSARIGLRDKVFCRVGASDNLVKGESTFLVEMSETAYILRQATSRSLVIMDEIGRGTSVNDGESIAQAVAEFFITQHIFTLFATHYHNLTDISHCNMKNFTLAIEKNKDDIIFTRKIKKGAVKNSYGIEVAKLAGIPETVLERAKVLLEKHIVLTNALIANESIPPSEKPAKRPTPAPQTNHIPDYLNTLIQTIDTIDINSITPLAALEIIVQLQKIMSAHFH